jgi:hypothetical protein
LECADSATKRHLYFYARHLNYIRFRGLFRNMDTLLSSLLFDCKDDELIKYLAERGFSASRSDGMAHIIDGCEGDVDPERRRSAFRSYVENFPRIAMESSTHLGDLVASEAFDDSMADMLRSHGGKCTARAFLEAESEAAIKWVLDRQGMSIHTLSCSVTIIDLFDLMSEPVFKWFSAGIASEYPMSSQEREHVKVVLLDICTDYERECSSDFGDMKLKLALKIINEQCASHELLDAVELIKEKLMPSTQATLLSAFGFEPEALS